MSFGSKESTPTKKAIHIGNMLVGHPTQNITNTISHKIKHGFKFTKLFLKELLLRRHLQLKKNSLTILLEMELFGIAEAGGEKMQKNLSKVDGHHLEYLIRRRASSRLQEMVFSGLQ